MNVVEYVGKEGVRSTDHASIYSRVSTPRPGDLVDCSAYDHYPYNGTSRAVIQAVNEEEQTAHVCVGGASTFLGDGWVSISGGPFLTIPLDALEWRLGCDWLHCWNWGDNGPGAGHGCYYQIARPVYVLTRGGRAKQ